MAKRQCAIHQLISNLYGLRNRRVEVLLWQGLGVEQAVRCCEVEKFTSAPLATIKGEKKEYVRSTTHDGGITESERCRCDVLNVVVVKFGIP